MTTIMEDAINSLVGRTIVSVELMLVADYEYVVLTLDDGSLVTVLKDGDGSGPGCLRILPANETRILYL